MPRVALAGRFILHMCGQHSGVAWLDVDLCAVERVWNGEVLSICVMVVVSEGKGRGDSSCNPSPLEISFFFFSTYYDTQLLVSSSCGPTPDMRPYDVYQKLLIDFEK